MAVFDPTQWLIIGVVAVAILIFGPKKIPQLARAIGGAKKEYKDATKAVEDPLSTPSTRPTATGDTALLDVAKKLGIETEGKTREEISQEIVNRAQTRS